MTDMSDRALAQIKAKLEILSTIVELLDAVGDEECYVDPDIETRMKNVLCSLLREIEPAATLSAGHHAADIDAEPDEPTILVSRKKLEELKKDQARWDFVEEKQADLYYYSDHKFWKVVDQTESRLGDFKSTARETVDSAMKV